MKHDLLISLRKYRPREGHDPLENFITEAFCWILKSYGDFSIFFIDHLFEKMNVEKKDIENHEWSTQANFEGFFPDMLCEFNNNFALVFENKAWAELHHNQIENYRAYAKKNYKENYKIILITATTKQHNQNPDLALCWSDVYKIIQNWIAQENNGNDFIFNDFLELIKSEGMAPLAPISQESIESYFAGGTELKSQVIDLSNKIKNCDWSKAKVALPSNKRQEPHLDKSEGRVGLYLLNDWNLNVFIGFLLLPEGNSYGYGITSVLGTKSPDFCVIISFFPESIRKNYPESETYKAFVNIIEKQIKVLNQGWDFVIAPNKWHPIHIRKPMLELFKGTLTSEEQDARFMESAEQILNIIFKSDEFKDLNKECLQLSEIQ
jgi:hypothetical protein